MSDKYNRIMNKIRVTEEMQDRILQNIEHENSGKKTQAINFERIIKIFTPVAACLVLILGVGSFIWRPSNEIPEGVQITNPINQVESAQELSCLLGYDIFEIEDVPFTVCDVKYISYNNTLGEIKYIGENDSCVFRQARGNQDISGDYTNYNYETQHTIGEKNAILRGERAESLIFVIWTDDAYSYSLEFSSGTPLEIVEQTILSIDSSGK